MLIGEAISSLQFIHSTNQLVPFDDIPNLLKKDFWKFMYGSTVTKNAKGQICAFHSDFKAWYEKLIVHGIDILEDEYTATA